MSTRREFLRQISTVSACAWGSLFDLRLPFAQTAPDTSTAQADRQTTSPDQWNSFGRISLHKLRDTIVIQDGFVLEQRAWQDCEFSFSARAPQDTAEVQIWAGIKCRDRDSRYVFALRGGNNDHLYLARYGPDGAARFLGIAPLDFHPVPGKWYSLRAVTRGQRILLYVNQEPLPRINVVDTEAAWTEGSVSLGGGWLSAEFRDVAIAPLSDERAAAIDQIGDQTLEPPRPDKQQQRLAERQRYSPVQIASFDQPRMQFSLDGNWLFLPDYELDPALAPQAASLDDQPWHVMDVPDFWTPCLTWLHNETGFNYLKGISSSKGISDKLYAREMDRLDGYTFDWRKTTGGWYRHHIDLPSSLDGRRLELCFDAIAKVSEVWLNGIKVGSHVGMFGEVRCDITQAANPGPNLLAVQVVGKLSTHTDKNSVVGVAVTVEVTSEMLNSLPHGMYPNDAGGIWQPVTLHVTQQTRIQEVFTRPRLDGLDFDVTIDSTSPVSASTEISYRITSVDSGDLLYAAPAPQALRTGQAPLTITLSTPALRPLPWTPWEPHLYQLELTLTSGNSVIDRYALPVGFRTFSVHQNKLLLNGEPFWLRGADHFPHALRPNDAGLAAKFIQMAKDGNVTVTRSHTAPFSKTWLDAADRVGMAVSFEGTWPWLMLQGPPPSAELLNDWKQEFLALIRKFRNHPSIIFWTVNNEMKFPAIDRNRPEQLQQKWEILSDMMHAIRSLDPTRPIVCDSSYCRKQIGAEYDSVIRPNHFDDGDIDDAHCYFGWYESTFFHFFRGEFGKARAYPGRPIISQEMATGYPRNDDGHPTRFYLFQHHTPQALVGADAYENRDPAIFLERQAFMTKELAEAIRRSDRADCSGILHFAYVSWFKDAWNTTTIEPFPTSIALRTALQPVLVSAELFGRHFYAGTKPKIRVCIANDATDRSALADASLIWEIRSASTLLAQGRQHLPSVPYYANAWAELTLDLPADLPAPRVAAKLVLRLQANGALRSENSYDLVLAARAWAAGSPTPRIAVLNTANTAKFSSFGSVRILHALADAQSNEVVIISAAEEWLSQPSTHGQLISFVNQGGRVLLLQAGAELPKLFPTQVKAFQTCPGEIVTMHIPESAVFAGLDPLDLSWFNLGDGTVPRACLGIYQIHSGRQDAQMLAEVTNIHGYLKVPSDLEKVFGSPLLDLRAGNGRLIASEMIFEDTVEDPIADRLLANLILTLDQQLA